MIELFRKIMCMLFNHEYVMDIYYDANVQKIKCSRCGKKFGINHSVMAIVDWDADLERDMKIIYPNLKEKQHEKTN